MDRLATLIKGMGFLKINEIAEDLKDKKIAVDDLYSYSGHEIVYCDDNAEWAVYFSHEDSITFFGAELLKRLKNDWPLWQQYSNPRNL